MSHLTSLQEQALDIDYRFNAIVEKYETKELANARAAEIKKEGTAKGRAYGVGASMEVYAGTEESDGVDYLVWYVHYYDR